MADSAGSQDQILDAAERLFARQGYVGTTIKEIGWEANVNPALLYYYYESKEALYKTMLHRIFGALVAEGTRGLAAAKSPDAAVRAFVKAQATLMVTRPHLPRLLVREMIDHKAAHAEEAITQLAAGMFARLCDVVRNGQDSGVFGAGLDPRYAAISIIAQLAYFYIANPAVGILLGHGSDGPPPDETERFIAHAADFALAALTASSKRCATAVR